MEMVQGLWHLPFLSQVKLDLWLNTVSQAGSIVLSLGRLTFPWFPHFLQILLPLLSEKMRRDKTLSLTVY